jgi:hypothetical protein
MTLAMAASEDESESKHSLDIIDSVPALISTVRPDDGYSDCFKQPWFDYVGLPITESYKAKSTADNNCSDQ